MPLFYYMTEDFPSRKRKFQKALLKLELEYVDFFTEVNKEWPNDYVSINSYIVFGTHNHINGLQVYFTFSHEGLPPLPYDLREKCINLFTMIFESFRPL
ncbi:hypothetical protein BDD43_3302 [Mucilaginibacter gracilis]|uniref:Uncharacterized protein n=1 Tax=Mucilaginibacter gracilis TaxID=423350 RepID=A0A495J345_9SPHI|nr:hypothetical protein BDD43_3302 [Mucilaginibacter gracilis]